MKEQDNNDQHKPLRDLLHKRETGDHADDFEREAAEGFRSLGSEDEIYALKDGLDEKIEPLFVTKKRRALAGWSMAAGVVLVLSLTVYFLWNDLAGNRQEVVQLNHDEKNEELAPAGAPVNTASPDVAPQTQEPQKNKSPKAAAPVNIQQPADNTRLAPASEPPAVKEEDPETREAPASAANDAVAPPEPPAAAAEQGKAAMAGATQREAATGKEAETKFDSRAEKAAKKKSAPSEAQPASADFGSDVNADEQLIGSLLRKDIPADLNKKFEAALIVSENRIKEVRFTGGELDNKEKSRLEKILKSLKPEDAREGYNLTDGEMKFQYRP